MNFLALLTFLALCLRSADSYQDFLAPLDSERKYNRFSLIQHLHSNLPIELKNSKAMDLDIVSDFIRRYFSHQDVSVDHILDKFRSLFSGYRSQWVDDMVSKTMRAIGIDMENDELVRQIKEDPKAYSIDYDTYKIVTYGR